MGKTLDLGRRIEIHSMDRHCAGISLGLYRRKAGDVVQFLVHTYSTAAGAAERTKFIRQALIVMAGLEPANEGSDWLQFSCGTDHRRALKRAFLDLCKLPTGSELKPKALTAFD